MQPLTGGRDHDPSAASYDEFGAASNEQPRSPWSPSTQPRSTSSSSNPYGSPPSSRPLPRPQARSYTRQPLPPPSPSAAQAEEQPHSSVCACEQCTLVKYGSTKAGSGTSKEEEGRLQREFRGESAGRRISLPGVFGRK